MSADWAASSGRRPPHAHRTSDVVAAAARTAFARRRVSDTHGTSDVCAFARSNAVGVSFGYGEK